MVGEAVDVLLFELYGTVFKSRLMNSMLMRVQCQNECVRSNDPAKKQEHEINGKFPE
jgi:hypothetical protein